MRPVTFVVVVLGWAVFSVQDASARDQMVGSLTPPDAAFVERHVPDERDESFFRTPWRLHEQPLPSAPVVAAVTSSFELATFGFGIGRRSTLPCVYAVAPGGFYRVSTVGGRLAWVQPVGAGFQTIEDYLVTATDCCFHDDFDGMVFSEPNPATRLPLIEGLLRGTAGLVVCPAQGGKPPDLGRVLLVAEPRQGAARLGGGLPGARDVLSCSSRDAEACVPVRVGLGGRWAWARTTDLGGRFSSLDECRDRGLFARLFCFEVTIKVLGTRRVAGELWLNVSLRCAEPYGRQLAELAAWVPAYDAQSRLTVFEALDG